MKVKDLKGIVTTTVRVTDDNGKCFGIEELPYLKDEVMELEIKEIFPNTRYGGIWIIVKAE